jgi:aspartate kinase
MPRLVMKFGGTSVADLPRIRNVAAHVKREIDAGFEVAVVVSAMAGKTNELVAWCKEAGSHFDNPEYDSVVASGELVTAGLLALVLKDMGLKARSWAGWQIPLVTDDTHGSARIAGIDGTRLGEGFAAGEIAVVAGFQGVHKATNRVTTLGRGGSDTSAVALAAAISADRCDIYTDVDGVYTSDPRVVPKARRLAKVAFEEMLEMASLGAKVLQVRSVELAMVNKVKLYVRSSFDDPAHPQLGTLICDEEEIMEQEVVTGIAFSRDEAQITLRDVADKPGGRVRARHDAAQAAAGEDRLRQTARRAGRGEDLGDRRRHALPFRRRRARLQGLGRKGRQHPRDHHVGDQVLDADRRRLYRARGSHAAYALRAGREVRRYRPPRPSRALRSRRDGRHFRSRFERFQGFAAPFPSDRLGRRRMGAERPGLSFQRRVLSY